MSIKVIPALALTALLFVPTAQAVSVTNRDTIDHTVTVIEGDAKQDHILKADAVLNGICTKGCLIRLDENEDDPYELQGQEVTSIEGGELWEDKLEAPVAPRSGDVGQPSPSSTGQ